METQYNEKPYLVGGYCDTYPGLVVILVDHSGSMEETWPGTGKTKSHIAADAVNMICDELTGKCLKGDSWVNKIYLAVIGYSGEDSFPANDGLTLQCKGWPETFGPRWRGKVADLRPILPEAHGNTPMASAIRFAAATIRAAHEKYPQLRRSFPPTVINVGDGNANDFKHGSGGTDSRVAAKELCEITTDWGSTLLMNVLIDPAMQGEVVFPDADAGMDGYGKFLFELSSTLPSYIVEKARAESYPVSAASRGFIVTQKPSLLIKTLRWGSWVAAGGEIG